MNQKVFSRQNVNLFTALLVFLVITGIAGLFLASLYSYNNGLEQIADKIEATLSGDEISDPEGYGLLVNSIVYGMGALGLWLARIILWVAVIYHVFLAFLQESYDLSLRRPRTAVSLPHRDRLLLLLYSCGNTAVVQRHKCGDSRFDTRPPACAGSHTGEYLLPYRGHSQKRNSVTK